MRSEDGLELLVAFEPVFTVSVSLTAVGVITLLAFWFRRKP